MYRLVLSLLILLLVAVFSIQNNATIQISFLTWVFPMPAVLLILGSMTLGALLTGFLGAFKQFGMGRKLRDYQNKIKKLEEELQKFRTETPGTEPEKTKPTGSGTGQTGEKMPM